LVIVDFFVSPPETFGTLLPISVGHAACWDELEDEQDSSPWACVHAKQGRMTSLPDDDDSIKYQPNLIN
jgi:hypothetical protein